MTINLIVKAGMIWFVIAVFAVINGAFRESVLLPGSAKVLLYRLAV